MYPKRTDKENQIVKVCILASSSAGNSAFIATGRTRILVDAGLSRREIAKRLAAIGEDIAALDAILVTHEHHDHVCGLPALAKNRRRPVPVYLTHGTAPYIDWGENQPPLETFQAGRSFTIGDFDISSFTIPHDATDPVGYYSLRARHQNRRGYRSRLRHRFARVHLRASDLVILESNHDLEMLRVGPYPWSVKQRVMGRRGHLSNEVAAGFIRNDLDSRVSTLILGHISEHNNHPELVRHSALNALHGRTCSPAWSSPNPVSNPKYLSISCRVGLQSQ